MNTDIERWMVAVDRRLGAELAGREPRAPRALTVLFDPGCALCQRCRSWMLGQARYVELEFVASTSEEARLRYGDLPWLGHELIVVGDGGEIWVGPAAFLTCLWALVEYREWSYRLASPGLSGLAERFFAGLSKNRAWFAALLEHRDCPDGSCSLEHRRGRL
jgi:predicted DCC family thiol-disulfide oxidoreductase YuxK